MPIDSSLRDFPSPFPPTRWPLIQVLQDPANVGYAEALDHFSRLYWKPTYCFLRARGCSMHEAEELAQEFFLTLMEGGWIQKVDPQRGLFRVFLRMYLRSFLADRTSPQRLRRQQVFERQHVSLDQIRRACGEVSEPSAGATPDEAFDYAFARSIIGAVRQTLRSACDNANNPEWNTIFVCAYPDDQLVEPMSQQAIAIRFGRSRDEIRGILNRMKELFLEMLYAEMRRYAGPDADMATEAAELLALVSQTRLRGCED